MMSVMRHVRRQAFRDVSPVLWSLLALMVILLSLTAGCASGGEVAGRSASPPEIEGVAARPAPVTLSPPAVGQMTKPAAAADERGSEAMPSAASDSGRIVHRAERIVVEKTALTTGETATVEEVLEQGFRLAGASPVHLAIRGTPAASSVRCAWRGVARDGATTRGRDSILVAVGPDRPDPGCRLPGILFSVFLDTLDPEFRETAKANFLAIARAGCRWTTCS